MLLFPFFLRLLGMYSVYINVNDGHVIVFASDKKLFRLVNKGQRELERGIQQ